MPAVLVCTALQMAIVLRQPTPGLIQHLNALPVAAGYRVDATGSGLIPCA